MCLFGLCGLELAMCVCLRVSIPVSEGPDAYQSSMAVARARATKSHSLAAVRILFYLCISGRAIIAVAQAGDSLIRYLCHSTSCRSLGVVFCLGALLRRAARFRYE